MKLKKIGHTICDQYLIFKKILSSKVGDFSPMPCLLGIIYILYREKAVALHPDMHRYLKSGLYVFSKKSSPENWGIIIYIQRAGRSFAPQHGLFEERAVCIFPKIQPGELGNYNIYTERRP